MQNAITCKYNIGRTKGKKPVLSMLQSCWIRDAADPEMVWLIGIVPWCNGQLIPDIDSCLPHWTTLFALLATCSAIGMWSFSFRLGPKSVSCLLAMVALLCCRPTVPDFRQSLFPPLLGAKENSLFFLLSFSCFSFFFFCLFLVFFLRVLYDCIFSTPLLVKNSLCRNYTACVFLDEKESK